MLDRNTWTHLTVDKRKRPQDYLQMYLQNEFTNHFIYVKTGFGIKQPTTVYSLVWFVGFNGISTFVGYLMPNPFLCK